MVSITHTLLTVFGVLFMAVGASPIPSVVVDLTAYRDKQNRVKEWLNSQAIANFGEKEMNEALMKSAIIDGRVDTSKFGAMETHQKITGNTKQPACKTQ